jgi:cytochrome c peroxidase
MEDAVRDMALYQADVKLSNSEVDAIVAFLRTLTGEHEGVLLSNPNEYGVIVTHDDDDHHHE